MLKWFRVRAGHYRAGHDGTTFEVVEYVRGDWELRVNGSHRTYSGTKRGAQRFAEDIVATALNR